MGSLEWNILSKITNLYVQVIFEPLLSNKRYVKNVHYVGQHQPTIIKQGSSPVATSTTGLKIQKNLKKLLYLNTTFHHLRLDHGAASIRNNQVDGCYSSTKHTNIIIINITMSVSIFVGQVSVLYLLMYKV